MNRIARIVGAKPESRRLSIVGSALLGVLVAMIGMAFVVVDNANAEPGTPTPAAAKTAPGPKASPAGDTDAAPAAIVAAVHIALEQLVAGGTINQSQATRIEQDVSAGHIDGEALVAQGVVTDAQMQAVEDTLGQVKRSFAASKSPTDAEPNCDLIASKLSHAVQDGKMTQEQVNQQLAGASCSAPAAKP